MVKQMNCSFLRVAGAMVLGATLGTSALAQDAIDTSAIDALPFSITVRGGVALPGTINIDSAVASNGFPAFSGTITFDPGPAVGIAIGTALTDELRAEVELDIANNRAISNSFTFTNGFTATGTMTGSVTTTALMAVGYYDFTQFGDFVPYLSGGVGIVNVFTNDLVSSVNTDGTTTGNSTVPALRLGAGFDFAVSENVSVGADYVAILGARSSLTFNDPVGGFTRAITADTVGHALSVHLKATF